MTSVIECSGPLSPQLRVEVMPRDQHERVLDLETLSHKEKRDQERRRENGTKA
jgi:hypothetical protein